MKDAFNDLMSQADGESHGKDYVNGGHPIHLVNMPARHDRGNYHSHVVHQGESTRDIRCRPQVLGQIEGPLHYTLWVVNPQGGMYTPKKDKYRILTNA